MNKSLKVNVYSAEQLRAASKFNNAINEKWLYCFVSFYALCAEPGQFFFNNASRYNKETHRNTHAYSHALSHDSYLQNYHLYFRV